MFNYIEEKLSAAAEFFSDKYIAFGQWYDNLPEDQQYAVALIAALILAIMYKTI